MIYAAIAGGIIMAIVLTIAIEIFNWWWKTRRDS